MGDRRARNFKRYFEEQGWSVELISVRPKAAGGPLMFWEFHRKLHQTSRNKKADIVLACDLYSLASARWLKIHGRVKHLFYDAREVYTELPTVVRKPLSKFVWRSLERKGLKATDIIIVTGPKDAQAICDVHHFLPRSVLVRNLPWLDKNIARDRKSLTKYGIPDNAKVAAYVGGLQRGRALQYIVEAIPNVKDVHLLLIGEGPLRANLESQAQALNIIDRVHFAGLLAPDKALRVTAACDIGLALIEPVSKSYELALPSKLFEYMMCGIPVISSNLSQVLELFAEEPWVTYANPANPDGIAVAIVQALVNSSSAGSTRARALAFSEYHFEHDAATLMDAIDKLLI